MTGLFKDRYKVALGMATLFFVGILVSFYQIYKLPHDLMLTETSHPALFSVYASLAITFLIGTATLWMALNYRNEVIVYREKEQMRSDSQADDGSTASGTISVQQLETELAHISNDDEMLQTGLNAVCKQLEAGQGALYVTVEGDDGTRKVELRKGYAVAVSETKVLSYDFGEGLIGQAAASGRSMYIDDIPEGYIKIISGLGSASPRFLMIAPIKQEESVRGVIEIASFTALSEEQRTFVEEAATLIASRLKN